MCNQLKVEFFKLRHLWIFYLGIVGMAGLGGAHGYMKLAKLATENGIYTGFSSACGDTSFVFLLSLVAAWFIGNDFSNRTIHHEITTGCSRWSVLVVRSIPVFFATTLLHFTYMFAEMVGVGMKTGISFQMFEKQDIFWFITVMLQIIAVQSIIILITFIVAKSAVAIATSVCFTFVTCNILRNFFEGKWFIWSCFCFAQDNTKETLLPTSICAIFTIIIAIISTYLIFRRKEIK